MEKETCIFRQTLTGYLNWTARYIQETYGVNVWFAEIMGRRWSYIAGSRGEESSLSPPSRIEITDRFGLVSDGWENIPSDESEAIISRLRETITAYG